MPANATLNALHVLPRVAAQSSGPTQSVTNLCRALADRSVNVFLKVLEPLPNRSLPFPAMAYPTLPWPGCYRLGVSPRLRSAICGAGHGVDVIHNHSLWMMPNIYPAAARRKTRCKLVMSPRGTLAEWSWQRSRGRKIVTWWLLGQRQALMLADMFHATSMAEYQDIRSRGFLQPISVISNGVEIPDLLTSQSDPPIRTLLYLSRIHPTKQVDLLLRVWSKLECGFPDWRLQIVGPLDNTYAQEMQRLSAGLGHERVSFSGELVGSEKWQAYRAADLFVLPTKTENFGLAIAEALASGTPVVTTKGAPWSGLDKHRCGWWIDDQELALEQCLRRVLGIPRKALREYGKRGRRWIEEQFGWPGVAARMEASYQWLIGRADRPAWVHHQ